MYFVRVINNKVLWDKSAELPDWVPSNEVDAHLMRDVYPSEGGLSLYEVDNLEQAELVAVAVASGRDGIRRVDFFLVPSDNVKRLGLRMEREAGTTPCATVNQWHVDLVDFTARQAAKLAEAVYYAEDLILREISKRDMKFLIGDAIKNQLLNPTKLSSKLQSELS